MIDEVQSLREYEYTQALRTVGYTEVFEFLKGNYTQEMMTEKIKQNTRNYAKRQITWFNHQGNYEWYSPDDLEGMIANITE